MQRKARRPSITGLEVAAKFAGEGAKIHYGRRRPFHEERGHVQENDPPNLVLGVQDVENLVLDLSNGGSTSEQERREQGGLLSEGLSLKLVPVVGDQVLRDVVTHNDVLPLGGRMPVPEGR